jgi:serine O-acetyltransferase
MKPAEDAHRKLEHIIDEVTESYRAGRKIDNLQSAALPNQRKVIDALDHLKHVMYMGFYATRALDSVNLRHNVGDHLYRAFDILVEQISRAVVYERVGGGEPRSEDRRWSEKAVVEVLERIPAIRELLTLDVESAYEGDPAASSVEEIIFSYPAVQAITVYRIAHEFYVREVPMIPRIMSESAHSRTGIDINPGARIGKSFFIDHGTGVVIGETCEIGDGVVLYQGVTLGAIAPRGGQVLRGVKRHPTIEDDVTIYAGATILGGETVIGRGSVIGGNVWLTHSVPPCSKVQIDPPRLQLQRDGACEEQDDQLHWDI